MSDDPHDLDLAELRDKISDMRKWLYRAFHEGCTEDDYCEGCTSCDAGVAIKHLGLIEKQLSYFTPKPKETP